MKRYFVLLVGGLALILFSSTAGATTTALIECGTGAGSVSGNTGFTGQPITITCPASAFTLPAGSTLTALSFEAVDDAQDPSGAGAGVTWTWTETDALGLGLSSTDSVTSPTGLSFNTCGTTTGVLVCGADISVPFGGTTVPTVTMSVSAAAVNGGVGVNGSDSAELYIDYTYTNTVTPEPATLSLVGAALLGLGMIARKQRKA